MRKYVIILLIVLLLGVFFFLPIIPGNSVFRTEKQQKSHDDFCATGLCGLLYSLTPFQFVKESLNNMLMSSSESNLNINTIGGVKPTEQRPEIPINNQ